MSESNDFSPDNAPTKALSWPALIATRVLLPGALVLSALLCAGAIMSARPSASQAAVERPPLTVEALSVTAETATARLYANGTIEPSRTVRVIPEVSGKVTWVSDAALPGGRLVAGEPLARIDPRDYSLRVEQARAQVRQAELELELERGRVAIAQKEWALLKSDRSPDEAPLALRGPQLATVEQSLSSARANLEQAELALSRTRFVVPFNAMVLDEALEVGQVVAPGAAVATLIGTDRFWVTVNLPVEELGAVLLPTGGSGGSLAVVSQDIGSGRSVVRKGQVEQLRAQLDPQTRTAQLLVAIDAPLDAGSGELPLLPGAYVDVVLEGRSMEGVVRIPRVAVRDGDHVWLAGSGVLERRAVDIGWKEGDDVFVTSGLSTGDRVITSPLAAPLDGLPVQILGGEGVEP